MALLDIWRGSVDSTSKLSHDDNDLENGKTTRRGE
jgi:hypothetical protein